MSTTIKYNISNIKQLIDLNGKAVNFQVDFKAVSLSNETFDALVVTQEMLDSNEPLSYQRAEGQINGQIKNDNGVYNNYFLCMKSDKPMEVEVSIRITPLQEQPELQQQIQQQEQYQQSLQQQQQIISQNQYNETEEDEAPMIKKPKKSKEMNYYVMGGVILLLTLLIGFTIYYYMKPKAETSTIDNVDSIIKEGFNNLENKLTKLNEVTSDGLNQVKTKVTDDFGKMHQNLYENIQELGEKITPPPIDTFSDDLGAIKESINNIKSHLYSKQQQLPELQIPSTPVSVVSVAAPILTTPSLDIDSSSFMHNNADEVLSRINSMKIKA